jgi:DNA-binding winged helix-turn-helix (wHTH) protein/Tol biopolymer transport system component
MPVGVKQKQTYRFGPFELDTQCGQLRKDGLGLKLQGQPVQILEILLEHPGQLVTREELRERLWASDTFVDFDHSLNTAIKKLRQALGDEADTPRYIETLPRRGYRFVGEVFRGDPREQTPTLVSAAMESSTTEHTPADKVQDKLETRKQRLPRVRWAVTSFGALLVVVAIGYWITRPLPMPYVVATHALTKTRYKKSAPYPSMVTDGTNIYFQELPPSGWRTMQVPVRGGEASELRIPGGNWRILRDISKDGSELLFDVSNGNEWYTEAWIQPLPIGPARLVVRDARWSVLSPDGSGVYFARNSDRDLYRANIDGTQVERVATFPDITGLAISPDGKRIRALPNTNYTMWESGSDGANPHPIFTDHKESVRIGNWSPDGEYFFFPSFDGERLNLWVASDGQHWLRRKSPLRQLTSGPLGFWTPIVSKDGKRLYAVGREPHGELSVYDPHSRQFVPYLGGISACFVDFSRDGQWVAYASYPEGTLWRSRIDGSERRQLTLPPLAVINPRWSPDGKLVVFADGQSSKIYVVSAEGGGPLLLVGGNEGGGDPTWSADGTQIAYAVNGPMTEAWIKVLDLKTQHSTKVPGSDGRWSPRWSPDGKHLLVLQGSPPLAISLFNFEKQQWQELSSVPSGGWPSWSRDSRFVYTAQGGNLVRISVPGGEVEVVTPRPAFPTTANFFSVWFGITPDGRPITTRDTGMEEIYAFDLQYK